MSNKNDRVVTNKTSNHDCHCWIEPVVSIGRNNNDARKRGTARRGRIGSGVEQDGSHVRSIAIVIVEIVHVIFE